MEPLDLELPLPLPATETLPEEPPAPRLVRLGDYLIGEKLGSGAMGSVYRATQISKNRPVALKVLRRRVASEPRLLERFRREALLMAELHHPNIVRCFSLGKHHDRHYLVMELVDGESLGKWLTRLGRLSVPDAVQVTLMVARALEYAHAHGLIHRDIKPDNVLIARTGEIKITDLGLARTLDEEKDAGLTHSGQGAGTPVYMAPEQARNARAADARSDLYALGCVLYHALTGEVPFKGENALEVVLAKVRGEHRPARELVPEIPERLDAIVEKLLEPHPDDRYQSCAELIEDLENLPVVPGWLSFLNASIEDTLPDLGSGSAPERPGLWFVRYRSRQGDNLTTQWTLEQLRQALHDPEFVATAEVGEREGDYQPIMRHPAFCESMAALSLVRDLTQNGLGAAEPEKHPWKLWLCGVTVLAGITWLAFLLFLR